MAERLPQDEIPIDTFIEVEQLIHYIFDTIIGTATERRDQLLGQLNDMRLEYLNKEEMRHKQVAEIDKMIRQLNEMNLQQNQVLKLQEDQVKNLEQQRFKIRFQNTLPVPSIKTEALESFLEQLRGLGTLDNMGQPYTQRFHPVRQFGKKGNSKGELQSPSGLAQLMNERLYLTDNNRRGIQVFSRDGRFVGDFGGDKLTNPNAITLTDKWVFVSDYRINKFRIVNNKFVCQSMRYVLNAPRGIAVDTNGEVLVADSDNNRIAVLNAELKFLREIGDDTLVHPCDVKVNNNNIFVADNNEINNIHIFTKPGDKIRSFIKLDNGTGTIYFCFDVYNNIVVSDSSSLSIQIFTINGHLIHQIACEDNPRGLAVDKNNSIICVCDNSVVYNY